MKVYHVGLMKIRREEKEEKKRRRRRRVRRGSGVRMNCVIRSRSSGNKPVTCHIICDTFCLLPSTRVFFQKHQCFISFRFLSYINTCNISKKTASRCTFCNEMCKKVKDTTFQTLNTTFHRFRTNCHTGNLDSNLHHHTKRKTYWR